MFESSAAGAGTRPVSSAGLPPSLKLLGIEQQGRKRYVLDTAADSDSDWDEEDWDGDDWDGERDVDGEEIRSWAAGEYARRVRQTRRLSALGSPSKDVIKEEREEGRVDVAPAIWQRNEKKPGQRGVGGFGAASRRRMAAEGKWRALDGVEREGDEGDVEC